jgi:hypothetical protein
LGIGDATMLLIYLVSAFMASRSAAGHGKNFPSTLKYPRSYKFSVSHVHGLMPVDMDLDNSEFNSEYNSEPLPGCLSFEPHSRWIPSLPRDERATLPPATSPLRAAPMPTLLPFLIKKINMLAALLFCTRPLNDLRSGLRLTYLRALHHLTRSSTNYHCLLISFIMYLKWIHPYY